MTIRSVFKITTCFLLITAAAKFASAQQKFEKAAFYNVMATGKLDAVESELAVVQAADIKNKEGYEGALTLKKAGMMPTPKQKLKFFKEGRIKLETAILADPDNTEFHFLRLAIEEHAPKIVKYRKDIDADKALIQKNYKDLPPSVQHAILDYCKNSKVLHVQDF